MRMEGQKWASLCPDQGCVCAKGGERQRVNTCETRLVYEGAWGIYEKYGG